MKRSVYPFLFLLTLISSFTEVGKTEIYRALSDGPEEAIDGMLSRLEKEKQSALGNAYIGTLLMKKAGYQKVAGSKMKMFKKGAMLLEAEIKRSPENPEFRFLRLTVQEHAPAMLKYNKNMEEDKDLIVRYYGRLDPALKLVVSKYSGSSKKIRPADLNI